MSLQEAATGAAVTYRTSVFEAQAQSVVTASDRGPAMYATAQSTQQIQSIFGAGYIQEQHADGRQCRLVRDTERHEPRFAEILEALRSALAVRR